ncbi:hypothetical protein QYE76_047105 [Lolium multiflorum]|uniref:Retrotransposon gag domain-containing protein n=1 Tax=Lolium multiflorum TaxID=4521 RepID=A0AAD8TR41_LOLMU|nr:hypothetical protein QYE76_047105 [Lolium multiflorum]
MTPLEGPWTCSHTQLKHHVEHLDFMLHETQKELDNSRVYANQTHLHLAEHADAIKILAKDRKSLRHACQEGRYHCAPPRKDSILGGNCSDPREPIEGDGRRSKTEEPLDADDWLQTMENNLEVAGVEPAEQVLFATHYLAGPARAWWTSTRAMNAGQMMTWADFKLKFSKYHVPPGLIKKMRDEFRELKQGRMSVVEYRDRFLTLSRYAPMKPTPRKRKERFLNGRMMRCRQSWSISPSPTLKPLVDSAIRWKANYQANENRAA